MNAHVVAFLIVLCRMAGVVLSLMGAIYLAFNGKDGWGWLLFASMLFCPRSYNSDMEYD